MHTVLDPGLYIEQISDYKLDPAQLDMLRHKGDQIVLATRQFFGKSFIAAARAVWRARFYKDQTIVILSPSQRQSSELLRRATNLCISGRLPIKDLSVQKIELDNRSRILSLPGSSDQTIRGLSIDELVIDESASLKSEIFFSILPALAVTKGTICAIGTPRAKMGWLWDLWSDEEDTHWKKTKITALDCPRVDMPFLKREEATMPAAFYRAEYMAEFMPAGENAVFDIETWDNCIDKTGQFNALEL